MSESPLKRIAKRPGFTFLELMIVVGIIAILVVVVIQLLDPVDKFQRAKNARRWLEVDAIAQAIKVSQVDREGRLISPMDRAAKNRNYMISYDLQLPQNLDCNAYCAPVEGNDDCLNFYGSPLVRRQYLRFFPIAPYDTHPWSTQYTGYYVQVNETGVVTVGSCDQPDIVTSK